MLDLDFRDARPIYEQVRDGLRRLMVTGVIREGEKLLASFDGVCSELFCLGLDAETLARRLKALKGGIGQ